MASENSYKQHTRMSAKNEKLKNKGYSTTESN